MSACLFCFFLSSSSSLPFLSRRTAQVTDKLCVCVTLVPTLFCTSSFAPPRFSSRVCVCRFRACVVGLCALVVGGPFIFFFSELLFFFYELPWSGVNCELSSTRRQGRFWSSGPTSTTPHACAPVDCPITWGLWISLEPKRNGKETKDTQSSLV